MARLPDPASYKTCPISSDDPIRFHYWPVIGALYRRRIDGCVALLGTGERVLDIGYGSGPSFLELAERFANVHGLDTHDYARSIAAVFAREGISVSLTRGSILDPPYADESFDAVVAISVLEHLRPGDQPRVMRQAHRLLKVGGILVVGVPGVNRLMSLGFRVLGIEIGPLHLSSPKIILQAASEVFAIERVVRQPQHGPDAFSTYLWFRARRSWR